MLLPEGKEKSFPSCLCGEQDWFRGFGVALHPFSKGGKRDKFEFCLEQN